MRKFRLFTLLTLLTLTSSLFAADRIVIEMNNAEYQGQNILNLKDLARRYTPGLDPMRTELKEVGLVAKSRQGMAETYLQIGNERSQVERINGNPMDYVIDRPMTYDNINLSVYGQPRVEWQLHLRGNIKIKRIILFVERSMGPGPADRIRLDFFGEEYQGENTIRLKQEIMRQFPQINLRDFNLKRVVLMAKSKAGKGTATLFIGGHRFYPEIISGNPQDYDYNAPYTYSRVILENNMMDVSADDGVWQVLLNGNIKIDSVVVFLERKYGNRW